MGNKAKFFPREDIQRAYPLVVGGGAIFATILGEEVKSFGGFVIERAELPPYGEVTIIFSINNQRTAEDGSGTVHGSAMAIVINDELRDHLVPLEYEQPATKDEIKAHKVIRAMYKNEEAEINRQMAIETLGDLISRAADNNTVSKNAKPL